MERGRNLDIFQGVADEDVIEADYIFFVHGWRMKQAEKISFAETAFKRLYWSGYQGRFGALTWPTGWFEKPAHVYSDLPLWWDYLRGNEQNYGKSEAVARRFGPYLHQQLVALRGGYREGLHVVAHSMGNVMVSEALRYAGDTRLLTSYSPSEAATVAGAYSLNAPEIRHKLKLLPSWYSPPDVPPDADADGLHSAERAWQAYGSTRINHIPATDFDMPPDYYRLLIDNMSRHGPTSYIATKDLIDKGKGKPYYESGRRAAGRVVNYFNPGDAALNGWEFNQLTKPDFLGGDTWRYSNEMYDCYAATIDLPLVIKFYERFKCRTSIQDVMSRYGNGSQVLRWNPNRGFWLGDNPEILAHIIPARTHALGQSNLNDSLIGSHRLQYGNSNQGHSAQFYSTFAERQDYWRILLRRSLGFKNRRDSEADGSMFKYSGLFDSRREGDTR